MRIALIATVVFQLLFFTASCQQSRSQVSRELASYRVDRWQQALRAPTSKTEEQILMRIPIKTRFHVYSEPPQSRVYETSNETFLGETPLAVDEDAIDGDPTAIIVYLRHLRYHRDDATQGWGTPTVFYQYRIEPTPRYVAQYSKDDTNFLHHAGWTWKAYKEGYNPTARRVTVQDVLADIPLEYLDAESVCNLIDPNQPAIIESQEPLVVAHNVLLELSPARTTISSSPSNTSAAAPTARQSSAAARQEYEAALANYNRALENYQNTRMLVAAPKAYPHPALGLFMKAIGEPSTLNTAERELEIARQRLERANARLDRSEW